MTGLLHLNAQSITTQASPQDNHHSNKYLAKFKNRIYDSLLPTTNNKNAKRQNIIYHGKKKRQSTDPCEVMYHGKDIFSTLQKHIARRRVNILNRVNWENGMNMEKTNSNDDGVKRSVNLDSSYTKCLNDVALRKRASNNKHSDMDEEEFVLKKQDNSKKHDEILSLRRDDVIDAKLRKKLGSVLTLLLQRDASKKENLQSPTRDFKKFEKRRPLVTLTLKGNYKRKVFNSLQRKNYDSTYGHVRILKAKALTKGSRMGPKGNSIDEKRILMKKIIETMKTLVAYE